MITLTFPADVGSIAPFEGKGVRVLVISQADAIHQEIENLLNALRELNRESSGEDR